MQSGSVEVWARPQCVVVSFQPGTTAVLEVDTAREFVRALSRAVDEAACAPVRPATRHHS